MTVTDDKRLCFGANVPGARLPSRGAREQEGVKARRYGAQLEGGGKQGIALHGERFFVFVVAGTWPQDSSPSKHLLTVVCLLGRRTMKLEHSQ